MGKTLLFVSDVFADDMKATLAAFALAEGFNVRVVLCKAVDNAAISSIKVEYLFLTGATYFLNPVLCLTLNLVCALALVVCNIDVYTGYLGVASDESHHDNVLESAKVISILTNKK